MNCYNCNKDFVFQTNIVFYYESFAADCLNDGNHDWKARKTLMECSCCGETRTPTEEEMRKIIESEM